MSSATKEKKAKNKNLSNPTNTITKKQHGRPTIYTEELVDTICEKIALGQSARSITREEDMPALTTMWRWLRENENFRQQYELATRERSEAQHEELLIFGDEAIKEAKEVNPKVSNAVVSAWKLKSDNLKWSMSKMKPKKYGDKIDFTTGGEKITGFNFLPVENTVIDIEPQNTDMSNSEENKEVNS